MLGVLSGARVGGERRATVGGHPAVVFDVDFSHGGAPYRRRQWVVEGASRIGYVGYTAPVSKWSLGEGVAEAMVATFALSGGDA